LLCIGSIKAIRLIYRVNATLLSRRSSATDHSVSAARQHIRTLRREVWLEWRYDKLILVPISPRRSLTRSFRLDLSRCAARTKQKARRRQGAPPSSFARPNISRIVTTWLLPATRKNYPLRAPTSRTTPNEFICFWSLAFSYILRISHNNERAIFSKVRLLVSPVEAPTYQPSPSSNRSLTELQPRFARIEQTERNSGTRSGDVRAHCRNYCLHPHEGAK
jgi:hypothetical protein